MFLGLLVGAIAHHSNETGPPAVNFADPEIDANDLPPNGRRWPHAGTPSRVGMPPQATNGPARSKAATEFRAQLGRIASEHDSDGRISVNDKAFGREHHDAFREFEDDLRCSCVLSAERSARRKRARAGFIPGAEAPHFQ